jgi:hypothetical protein
MSKITENRSLHFDTLAEGMSEAERLATVPTKTAGRFSHAQNIDHLARTLRIVVGDAPAPKFPRLLKWLVRFRLNAILTEQAKPGIKLPAKVQPVFWNSEEISVEEAMESLRSGYERFNESLLKGMPVHPLFGTLSNQQHEQLQCRHFELHLGMVIG